MPKLIQAHPDHVVSLYPRLRGDAKDHSLMDMIQIVRSATQLGPAYTVIGDDGKVLGIGGMVIMHRGVGQLWMALSPSLFRHKIWFHKTMKKMMIPLMNQHQLHRLQAEVVEGKPNWVEWTKRFGFEEEGVMKKYGPTGKDFTRIAFTR